MMSQPFSRLSFNAIRCGLSALGHRLWVSGPTADGRQRTALPRLFALALLLTLAAPGGASVRRLTHDNRADDQPRVNGAGQVIWVTAYPSPPGLYLWDGASVQQLSTNVDSRFDHQITENGQVVWQGATRDTSQLLLWDGRMVR